MTSYLLNSFKNILNKDLINGAFNGESEKSKSTLLILVLLSG